MNGLFIKHFCMGFMVSEIPIVSVFGYFPLRNICECTTLRSSMNHDSCHVTLMVSHGTN